MAKFPALMLWTDAWIADTGHLSRCERGTYMDLLILMWRTPGCSIPNDDQWLARRLRMTPAEIQTELRPLISEFCQTDGNRIFQKRLANEYQHAGKKSYAQSVRAKSRWNNKKNYARAMPPISTTTFDLSSEYNTTRARARKGPKKQEYKWINEESACGKAVTTEPNKRSVENGADKDRSQRPTYQELVAKHGPNWGLNKTGTEDPQ